MWSNLCWFGQEFRDGDLTLVTGDLVSVRTFMDRGRGFDVADIREMVQVQYRIMMRAIVPIHRVLEERGQVELTTTPFYHPILPLLRVVDRMAADTVHAARAGRWCDGGDPALRHRLGPFAEGPTKLRFRFRCTHPRCDCREACCRGAAFVVQVTRA